MRACVSPWASSQRVSQRVSPASVPESGAFGKCDKLNREDETKVPCRRLRAWYTGRRKALAFRRKAAASRTGLAESALKLTGLEADAPGADDGAITTALLQVEAQRAWQPVQAGVIRELYFRADRHAAVLVLECASVQEAHEVLATLPLVL